MDASGTRVRDLMTVNVVSIKADSDVKLAIQMMLWGGFRHLPVVDHHDRLVGMLTEHDLYPPEARKRESVRSLMSTDLVTVAPDDPVAEAAALMAAARVGSLPVVANGKLVGILTSTDVLAHVGRTLPHEPRETERVCDVMAVLPRTVTTSTPLEEAVVEMIHHDIRHLPVVDSDDQLVGMLSDRDVRALIGDPVLALREERLDGTLSLTVDEVMTPDPVAVYADEPTEVLARALVDERIGAVAVLNRKERLVGIVSYVDVLRRVLMDRPPRFSAAS